MFLSDIFNILVSYESVSTDWGFGLGFFFFHHVSGIWEERFFFPPYKVYVA